MRLLFTVVIITGFQLFTYAQDKKPEPVKRWAASISPGTVPIPPNSISLQPGIEFFITRRLSVLNEAALQIDKKDNIDSSALNKRYFKYKAEARFYFDYGESAVIPFLALQFTTARRSFDAGKAGHYYETFQDDSVYSYTKASINSPVQTITIQGGAAVRIAEGLYTDFSFGYGFRFTNTEYSSAENLQKVRNANFFNIKPISSYRYAGKLTRSQFNFGVRISYRF